ncbi:hypothetical protein [Nonomuraea sp. NPDC050202]|uniref:hypothetical protein n=1 Tax=Nonomuraea sp. NPDC050202 TaxID=3155035 RepID=UPI0033E16EC5
MTDAASYLLILSDRQAIAWVLREQRMAFPATSRAEVAALRAGDELLIYTTRGASRNPTRDRGRIVGRAVVTTTPGPLNDPVTFAGRTFVTGCEIRLEVLAAWGTGVELHTLVDELSVFPNPAAWSIMLRRPLLRLPEEDTLRIWEKLEPLAGNPTDNLVGYLAHDRLPAVQRRLLR